MDQNSARWYADSCAAIHITNDIKDLEGPQPHSEAVRTGGGPVSSTHKGAATVKGIKLEPVLYIPDFHQN